MNHHNNSKPHQVQVRYTSDYNDRGALYDTHATAEAAQKAANKLNKDFRMWGVRKTAWVVSPR